MSFFLFLDFLCAFQSFKQFMRTQTRQAQMDEFKIERIKSCVNCVANKLGNLWD